MEQISLKIKKINKDCFLPCYAHPGDVGLDLRSLEDYRLAPGERRIFFLGFALEFASGYAALVFDKGSLPVKGGLHVLGGVYDAGYRGEYNVILVNLGQEAYDIKKGDKIAQLLIIPVYRARLKQVNGLTPSARGEGRFGSTGR